MAKGDRLTNKQRKFALNAISGMDNSDAYRDAYPASRKWKSSSVANSAQTLRRNPLVSAFIEEGQQKALQGAILTRQRALEILSEQAEGKAMSVTRTSTSTPEGTVTSVAEKTLVSDSKAAIDSLAKLEGWNKEKSVGESEGVILNFNLSPSKGK